jgi:hypothetical protein
MIVGNIVVMVVEAMRHRHNVPVKADRFHFPREEIDSLQEFSDWIDDICEIEITGCDLMQHWRKQEEVVAIYQCDFDIGIAGQRVIEMNRRMQPGETATENQNPSFLL